MLKLKKTNKGKEFSKMLSMYYEQIEELIKQRENWRIMALDLKNSIETRNLARQNVIVITKNIAELEAARQRFIEESF